MKVNNKVNYKDYNKKMYRRRYRRGLTKYEYDILWTAIWLLFIGGLCLLFNNGLPLCFLIIWFFGII